MRSPFSSRRPQRHYGFTPDVTARGSDQSGELAMRNIPRPRATNDTMGERVLLRSRVRTCTIEFSAAV